MLEVNIKQCGLFQAPGCPCLWPWNVVAVDFWRVLLAFFCSPICDSTLTQSLLIVKGCCLLSLLTPSEYALQIRPSLIKFTVQTWPYINLTHLSSISGICQLRDISTNPRPGRSHSSRVRLTEVTQENSIEGQEAESWQPLLNDDARNNNNQRRRKLFLVPTIVLDNILWAFKYILPIKFLQHHETSTITPSLHVRKLGLKTGPRTEHKSLSDYSKTHVLRSKSCCVLTLGSYSTANPSFRILIFWYLS